ncbi:MAG: hypothetical protein Q4G58_06020 [bacterium]|nr:hypothetical protein [bacterium]
MMKLLATILLVQIAMGLLNEWAINYLQDRDRFKVNIARYLLHGIVGMLLSYVCIYLYIGNDQLQKCSIAEYMLLSMGCTGVIMFVVYEILNRRNKFVTWKVENRKWKFVFALCKFAMIAIVLEIVLFNYQHIITRNNQYVESNTTVGKGLEKIKGNTYKVVSKEDVTVIFDEFDAHIKNILFDINRYSPTVDANMATTVRFAATDAANATFFYCGKREIVGKVERSHNAMVSLSGNSKSIRLTLDAEKEDIITINNMGLNTVVPFEFMWLRIIAIFAGLTVLYIVRPSSQLYGVKFSKKSKIQWAVTACVIAVEIVLFCVVVYSNTSIKYPQWDHHRQYQELAHSMANGKLSIDRPVSQTLNEIVNPYDRHLRDKTLREAGESYCWDHAYYNGKYYVYFGVVPELIFYLPYYLITGQDFNTSVGICILALLLMIAVSQLNRIILERWFRKTSYLVYLMITVAMINGMGLMYFMTHADFYCMPIACGLLFAITGLCFWISSIKETKISGGYMFFGSLCIALIAGCRPQLIIIAFLAFPLFWKEIVEKRNLFSKKSLGVTIGAVVPFVLVAAGLMYYNYARFNSPFDFGANYNLTTNDMTNRIFSMKLSIAGLFTYLLQPVNVGMQFPFILSSSKNFSFIGMNIYETMYGGLLINSAILWCLVLKGKVKEQLQRKQIYTILNLLIIFGFGLVLVDIRGAGILPRYLCDFSWLFYIAAVFIVFAVEEKMQETKKESSIRRWHKAYAAMSIITVIYNVCLAFSNGSSFLTLRSAEFYYRILYAVNFWN